jgi:hypothetical protein
MATDLARPQSHANHRAHTPVYLAAGLVLAVDVVVRIVQAARDPDAAAVWAVVVGAALVVVWATSRRKAQIVQDRLIRLEMRLRLARVLPAERHGEIERLSLGQLVALRFASDAELPELVRSVLAEDLTSRDAIKRRVRDWQADWMRV